MNNIAIMPTITAPQLGDPVIFDQTRSGTVARVHRPGDRDSHVDLTFIEANVLRVAQNVLHMAGPGGWRFEAEAKSERIMSDLEILEAARARGERVPNIGDWVKYGYETGTNGMIEVLPTRARIVAINSLTSVDVDVYRPQPPDQVDEEDLPINFGRRQQVLQAEAAPESMKKLAYGGCWSYLDSDLIRAFGPRERWRIFPPFTCRCGTPVKTLIPVFIGEPFTSVGDPDTSNSPVVRLCKACIDQLREHIANPSESRVAATLTPALT